MRDSAAAIGAKVEQHLCARPKGIQDHSEWLRTANSAADGQTCQDVAAQPSSLPFGTVDTLMRIDSMNFNDIISR